MIIIDYSCKLFVLYHGTADCPVFDGCYEFCSELIVIILSLSLPGRWFFKSNQIQNYFTIFFMMRNHCCIFFPKTDTNHCNILSSPDFGMC